MRLTERGLNRATLARQLLLERSGSSVVDAVGRLLGLQAQEPASPYLALWNRLADFDPADLDRALQGRDVVKATLMRGTLHAVAATDYPTFHSAIVPSLRAGRLADRRFARTELTVDDIDGLLLTLLDFAATPRSTAELSELLDGPDRPEPPVLTTGKWPARVPGSQDVWWALRAFAPLVHAPTGGPWSFGPRPSYVAAPVPPAPGSRADRIGALAVRYLSAFGPATVADFSQFTGLSMPLARAGLAALDELEQHEGPGGTTYFDIPGGARPEPDAPAPPRLLGMWDNALLAYAGRSRALPDDYRKLVIRPNGDILAALLVDGQVAGVWRPVETAAGLVIEATAFHALSPADWSGIATEAAALIRFLEPRDRTVYRRYRRWWEALPRTEVRRLPS